MTDHKFYWKEVEEIRIGSKAEQLMDEKSQEANDYRSHSSTREQMDMCG